MSTSDPARQPHSALAEGRDARTGRRRGGCVDAPTSARPTRSRTAARALGPGHPDRAGHGFDDPANYTQPPSLDPESFFTDPNHDSTDPVNTAANAASESANGIPAAALTAYQRTEAVLAQADPACHLPWELVAAIGRVESDHGRHARQRPRRRRQVQAGHLRPTPRRTYRNRLRRRHRRAATLRQGHGLRPRRRPDAIHPGHVGDRRRGRGRRPTSATRKTSTTRRWPPASTSALGTTTSPPSRPARLRCSATTTAMPTSTLVLAIMRAYAAGNYSAVANGHAQQR